MGSVEGDAVGDCVGSGVAAPEVYVGDNVGLPEGAAVGLTVG